MAEVSDPVARVVATLGCDLAGVAVIHKDPASPDRMAGWALHDSRTGAPGPDEIPCFGGRMRPRAFHTYGFCYGLVGPLVTGAPVHWCPPRSVPSQLGRAVRGSGARTLIALPAQGPPSEGIRLAGRRSSVINVAAEEVSPAEVERVLAAHPQVVDVQVIGAPDPLRVQVPVARVVVSDAAATREAR